MASLSGHRFGRYQVQALLGQGAFATVYRAHDPALQRSVAIKVLHGDLATDPELAARFQGEARQIARLRHAHIVSIHDVGEQDGRPYFAMDLIEGQTLAALIQAQGVLSVSETITIATQLASALDYLHARAIVHRDLKPSNVMVGADGRVTLMDFGVARALDQPGLTAVGSVLGTPVYMAPEQVRGQHIGPAADIYAFAVLLYYCLSGRPPFEGDTLAVFHAHVTEPPPALALLRPGLPTQVYHAIDLGLAKDPAGRPRSAGALVGALAVPGSSARPERFVSPALEPADTATSSAAFAVTTAFQPTSRDEPDALATTGAPAPPLPPHRSRSGRYLTGVAALVGVAAVGVGIAIATADHRPASSHRASAAPSPFAAGTAASPGLQVPASTSRLTATSASPQATAVTAAASPSPASAATRPATPAATPPPAVPLGDYRLVQNSGDAKCIRGRAQPGTGGQIYVCVRDGFVVRLTGDAPQTVDGFAWYNADGIGWMAAQDLRADVTYLRTVPLPAPPATSVAGCWDLLLTTTIDGEYHAPQALNFVVDAARGPAFAASDGTISGWAYASDLYLKYQLTLSGRPASGTIVAHRTAAGSGTSESRIEGDFVATAFQNATNGAYGRVSGSLHTC